MRKRSSETLKEALVAVLCVALVAVVLLLVGSYSSQKAENDGRYYSSQCSKYCYPENISQTRIKTRIYYSSLEECGKPLPK